MRIRVEKTHNYTVMSNYHLFDKRLSFKAKGLLSFMLAVPDSWEFSIKGLAAMAKDGVDSVATTLKEMEKYGYVSRRQIRNEKGSFKEVEYTIYECPIDNGNGGDSGSNDSVPSDLENNKISEESERKENNAFSGQRKNKSEDKKDKLKRAESRQISVTQPNRENPVSGEPKQKQSEDTAFLSKKPNRENPISGFPRSGNPISVNPDLENPPQINTNISNILTEVNTNLIKSYPDMDTDDDNETAFYGSAVYSDKGSDTGEDYSRYESIIKNNICYEDVLRKQCTEKEMEQVDFMIQLMTETMVSSAKTVRIGKSELPVNLVKGRFMDIWYEDIFAVLRSIEASSTQIKYIKNYYMTAIYYANHTENIKLQQQFKDVHKTESVRNDNKRIDDYSFALRLMEV
ncbi:MAG: DUF6017 domain-containing protein [Clostridiales bacterium]|nr:DUF6017 domain-containing protein [Clostridiales bacterium]